jgi:16S rRNA (guanine966-N2)-methyltransferase
MRIIAGKFRSRVLRSAHGLEIRPTSDRLRETLFNVLTGGNSSALDESVWIDLFAGTGAVGIEALSRGAGMVYFVEHSKAAAELIRKNLRSLEIAGNYQLFCQHAKAGIARLEKQEISADFVFLDPPYHLREEYRDTLAALGGSLLSEKALVIAEHEKRFDPGEEFGRLRRIRRLYQGDASLSFYRRSL